MEYYKDNWDNDAHKPEKSLKVVIVGAGVAGLSVGIGENAHPTDGVGYRRLIQFQDSSVLVIHQSSSKGLKRSPRWAPEFSSRQTI